MGSRTLTYARILATGSALPERVVTNDDLAKIVDTSTEKMRRKKKWLGISRLVPYFRPSAMSQASSTTRTLSSPATTISTQPYS